MEVGGGLEGECEESFEREGSQWEVNGNWHACVVTGTFQAILGVSDVSLWFAVCW